MNRNTKQWLPVRGGRVSTLAKELREADPALAFGESILKADQLIRDVDGLERRAYTMASPLPPMHGPALRPVSLEQQRDYRDTVFTVLRRLFPVTATLDLAGMLADRAAGLDPKARMKKTSPSLAEIVVDPFLSPRHRDMIQLAIKNIDTTTLTDNFKDPPQEQPTGRR